MLQLPGFLVDIRDFLEAGGTVVQLLLVVALVLWTLIFERMLFYFFSLPKLLRGVKQHWSHCAGLDAWSAEKIRMKLVAETQRQIRGPLPAIKTFVALCPLIGLLGTVTGMIQIFEVMAVVGTGNAREMASGVSAATLPTLAGMVLALSGMYPAAKFESITERETHRLRDHMTAVRGEYVQNQT